MHKLLKNTLTAIVMFNVGLTAYAAGERMTDKVDRERAEASHQGAGEYIDDSAITAKVKAALVAEPDLKSTNIKVVTFKGGVTLNGVLSSRTQIQKALDATRHVNGVRSVKNELHLP